MHATAARRKGPTRGGDGGAARFLGHAWGGRCAAALREKLSPVLRNCATHTQDTLKYSACGWQADNERACSNAYMRIMRFEV